MAEPSLAGMTAPELTIQSASEYDYPPFSIVTENGQADGFSVELMRAALRTVGRDVEFKVDSWNTIKNDLELGRIDALPVVGRNAERAKVFDFTLPYYSLHGAIFVRKGENRISGISDLSDMTVVVMKSDTGSDYVKLNQLSDKVIETETLEIAFSQLSEGNYDALVATRLVGENIINQLGLENIDIAGSPLEKFSDFCFAVRKGNSELLAMLNEGLSIVIADGTLEELREKWIIKTPGEQLENTRNLVVSSLITMLVAGLIAIVWMQTLRKTVRARTRELNAAITEKQDEIRRRMAIGDALKESESLHRSMIETLPLAIYVFSGQDQVCEYLNPTFVKLFGYGKDDVPSIADWWPRACPDVSYRKKCAEQWQRRVTHAIETQTATEPMEAIVRCKDGSKRIVSWVFITLGDKNFAVGTDLTAQKEAERELSIAAISFDSQEGMAVTDANADILKVNSAFTRITGYNSEEVLGRNPRILKSGRHDKTFYENMWNKIRSSGAWEGEIWNCRKNGEVFPQHLIITAVKDSAGATSNYVAAFIDITLSKATADKIRNLAFYDSLTKLPNRRLLRDRLVHLQASLSRSGKEGALLFIDLDNFKNLNDTLGHDIGDLLLQQVAERLKLCIRKGDTVARLGGDEFLVMLEDLSENNIKAAAQAETIAQKIQDALNQPYQLATHSCQNTPSIGITLIQNHHQSVEELLKQADLAMYQSKKDGRNTIRFFDPKMKESLQQLVQLNDDLNQALATMQFVLYYQIQMDDSNHPLGAEALIRWQHPKRGLISPEEFVPHAEETGLILTIGNWVLKTACQVLQAWGQFAHTRELILAINVSAKQFQQADFVAYVKAQIEHFAINPERLKLELTESLLLLDTDDTISKMQSLSQLGIHLSLDDFGTGYSSLQYLKRLPLDELKIDKSFTEDIETDSDDREIVSTIIAMAKNLNVDVIAEGVETGPQKQFLIEKGCVRFQGYLFGKPQPLGEFTESVNLIADKGQK